MDTKSEKSENVHLPQTELKHPPEYMADLNPDHMAGQNVGERSANLEQITRNAYDFKEVHRSLGGDFTDDELRSISVLTPGQRLQQGATYVDLAASKREEFTAMGNVVAGENNWYVPKNETPYSLWNRLIGITNPERLPDR
jgi:hypothetical protein